MLTGKVKSYSEQRGFGFITSESDGEVFVYYTGILGDGFRKLEAGQEVQFVIVQGKRGPQAAKVAPVETTTDQEA
ncbi:MAG TPA: cold shock domain-containing protein [Candidatus Levilactobacillus faecigallinarum]|uniref:Cold shock domain-containing protein n=1 Tax=Candidatus Levilactobacillus faecigallinarum TaxID=2838638 RepID=A0A9D1QSA9_9LACO|nr:cold shock domain-containing protein [Candidatus Levilactobacillus faecigallinarum]